VGAGEDLFDPPGRRGVPATYSRHEMADAILFLARTGCQWRHLPDRFPPWAAVWQQWRRLREKSVGAKAMVRLAAILGLPIAARVDPARPHDLKLGRDLAERFRTLPGVQAIVPDRGYRGLAALASRKHVKLDIKAPPKGTVASRRSARSSTRSRSLGFGGGCRAAARAPRRAPAPGPKSPRSATCSGGCDG